MNSGLVCFVLFCNFLRCTASAWPMPTSSTSVARVIWMVGRIGRWILVVLMLRGRLLLVILEFWRGTFKTTSFGGIMSSIPPFSAFIWVKTGICFKNCQISSGFGVMIFHQYYAILFSDKETWDKFWIFGETSFSIDTSAAGAHSRHGKWIAFSPTSAPPKPFHHITLKREIILKRAELYSDIVL